MSVLGAAAARRAQSPRRSVVGRGLAGVLLTFAVLATLQALTIYPFHPPDEVSHVGYALEVSHGTQPTIETPIPGHETPLTRRRLVLLAVLAAAAALTRATGLIVVAAAGLAAVVAVWRHDGRPARTRAVRAIAAGGAIVVTAAAAAGWFYVRNRHLYGSATGTGAPYCRSSLGIGAERSCRRCWGRTSGAANSAGCGTTRPDHRGRTASRRGTTSPSSRSSA